MAQRHDRQEKQLKEEVTERASSVIFVTALIALIAAALINAIYGERSVPDIVFWILAAVLVPDGLKKAKEKLGL